MLSVMVILLSEMNSYRMRVAMAVFNPSSAPCLVFALLKRHKTIRIFFLPPSRQLCNCKTVLDLLSTVLSMNPFSLY